MLLLSDELLPQNFLDTWSLLWICCKHLLQEGLEVFIKHLVVAQSFLNEILREVLVLQAVDAEGTASEVYVP